jgi:hypothetical protein
MTKPMPFDEKRRCIVKDCRGEAIEPFGRCRDHGCNHCGDIYEQETRNWLAHLCSNHLTKLRALGGGATDRLGVEDLPPPPPDLPPRVYPPLGAFYGTRPEGGECQHFDRPIVRFTAGWPEPLCGECFGTAFARPPRAVLTMFDGTREMRRNPIVGKRYRDVTIVGEDVRVLWFERVEEQTLGGKPVMSFYTQIPAPVTSLGKPIEKSETPAKPRRVSWIRRFIRWVKVWLAVRGIA